MVGPALSSSTELTCRTFLDLAVVPGLLYSAVAVIERPTLTVPGVYSGVEGSYKEVSTIFPDVFSIRQLEPPLFYLRYRTCASSFCG